MGVHRKIRFLGGSQKPIYKGGRQKEGVVFFWGGVDTPMHTMYAYRFDL